MNVDVWLEAVKTRDQEFATVCRAPEDDQKSCPHSGVKRDRQVECWGEREQVVDEERLALPAPGWCSPISRLQKKSLLARSETPGKAMDDVPSVHTSDDVRHCRSGVKTNQTSNEGLEDVEVYRAPQRLRHVMSVTEDMKHKETRAVRLRRGVCIAES